MLPVGLFMDLLADLNKNLIQEVYKIGLSKTPSFGEFIRLVNIEVEGIFKKMTHLIK